MAKENKGHFKKGQNANPAGSGGRPPLEPAVREANKLTKSQILEVIARMMVARQGDCERIMNDPNSPMFHKAVASIFHIAVTEACEKKLDFILNRLIGKITDKIEVDHKKPVIIRYAEGDAVYLGPDPKEQE